MITLKTVPLADLMALFKPKRERTEDGASAVEYGLLVAAIAALIVIIVFALGNVVKGTFDHTCDTIASKTAPVQTSCVE
jgi:pilus assembly protein Flp/PilA